MEHCYPLTPEMWLRETQFNFFRADYCARYCRMNMIEIEQAQQQGMIKFIRDANADECDQKFYKEPRPPK